MAAKGANTVETAAQARRERFGKLPEPVPFSALVEEHPVGSRSRAEDGYNAERAWLSHSCVPLDLAF
jgi:hypothetical protein